MPTPSSQPNPDFDFADPLDRRQPIPEAFKAPPPGNLANPSTSPPPTRIFPRAINPPPQISRPPRAAGARTGGRIAGSFKFPPASGVAARGAARVGGRAVPIIGTLLLAYDAYQLGCAFQLLPGSICPRPDNPSPGGSLQEFQGGQCPTAYNVNIEVFQTRGGQIFSNGGSVQNVLGPVYGLVTEKTGNAQSGYGIRIFIRCTSGFTGQPTNSQHYGASGDVEVWGDYAVIRSIVRQDGQPDNCGNPPSNPVPRQPPDFIFNLTKTNNNININITLPSPQPPSPLPKPVPRRVTPPFPLPDIILNFGDNYFGGGDDDPDFDIDINFSPAPGGNFRDYPDNFNNFPPSPQPRPRTPDPIPRENPTPQPAPQPAPQPELPPPLPDTLPPDATDSDRYNFRIGRETLDKLYRANAEILEIQSEQLNQRRILENIQSLLDIEVEGSQLIKRCDDIETFYTYKDKVLRAINKQLDHVKQIEQTLIDEVCAVETSSVVAAPDWWQVRIQGDVPQIALIFRAMGTKTYHRLTIPHPLNTNKPSTAPITNYRKGNWQGEIVCLDNSKFLVNCASKIEAERVVNIALSLIDVSWAGLTPRIYFAERKGVTVSEGEMKATSALYFPTGQKQMMPEWRKNFR